MKPRQLNPFRLLNSVSFAIFVAVFAGAYIAVGMVRPWSSGWIDQSNTQYFKAWPLTTLLILTMASLMTLTWRRVPLTPARYGAWCMNTGIIVLVGGLSLHFARRVEGWVRIYRDPSVGPTTVDRFYDQDQRSLFIRLGQESPVEIPVPALPRFVEYDQTRANSTARSGLVGIEPGVETTDAATGQTHVDNLAELIGCTGQHLKVDVAAFYPYASISTDFASDAASQFTGVRVSIPAGERWLAGADPRFRVVADIAGMEFQHLDVDAAGASGLIDAADKLFHLDVTLPGQAVMPLDVQVGKTYRVGQSGYVLRVESLMPHPAISATADRAAAIQILVTSPTQIFRRVVMQNPAFEADFKPDDPTGEAIAAGQKAAMDPALKIEFHVHDPFQLLPQQKSVRHTFLTPPGGVELVDITAGTGSTGVSVVRSSSGVEDLRTDQKIHVERRDHVRIVDSFVPVPAAARVRDDGGSHQVVKLRVSMGGWSSLLTVPFADDAADHLLQDHWRGGFVKPPGSIAPLQFQLGNSTRPLPVSLTLLESGGATATDGRVTFSLTDPATGASSIETVTVDHPIYFSGGKWVFRQTAFDPGRKWIQLKVQSRPAMTLGMGACAMILVGSAYSLFYRLVTRRKKRVIV